jgi:hypothetical protein
MVWTMAEGAATLRARFAIARLDARLSFENAERNARREGPGRVQEGREGPDLPVPPAVWHFSTNVRGG